MPAAPRYDLGRVGCSRGHAARLAQTACSQARATASRTAGTISWAQRVSAVAVGAFIRRTAMDETGRAMIEHGAGELADPLVDGSAERAAVAGPGPVAAECR